MSSQAVFIKAGTPQPAQERGTELKQAIIQLMAVPLDDHDEGWRVIATYPGQGYQSTGYRSAHARAGKIRQGKVSYFNQFGKFDALARSMGEGMVGLYVRWLGEDGKRWG